MESLRHLTAFLQSKCPTCLRLRRAISVNLSLAAHRTAVIEARFRIQLHLFYATTFVRTLVYDCFYPIAQLSFIAMVSVQCSFTLSFFAFIYFTHEIIVESLCVS